MTQLVYHPPDPSAHDSGPAPAQVRATALPMPAAMAFQLSADRWERWVAKGLERDRVVRRRFQVMGFIILAVGLGGWLLWTI